jgi:hypothetical protein
MTDSKALLTPLSVFGKPTELVYQAGKDAERERIMALLRDDDRMLYENGKCQLENHWPEMCNCRVIALIKGENK